MRTTFATMGTVASLSLQASTTTDAVESLFASFDATFSLYRPSSPMSALARGEMALADAPEVIREEYARALAWRSSTGGWFTPHRPDGTLDLSGTVKAVAMQRAVDDLATRGASGFLGVGGDIALVGAPASPSSVGIVDPADRSALLVAVELGPRRRAVATSGSAERGDHIWTRLGRSDIAQASVLADDIITADVLATALIAAGTQHIDELTAAFDIDALLVLEDRTILATPGFVSHAGLSAL